jgi:hypothetical protein
MMKSLLLLLLGLLPAAALAVPPLYTVTAASGKDERAIGPVPAVPELPESVMLLAALALGARLVGMMAAQGHRPARPGRAPAAPRVRARLRGGDGHGQRQVRREPVQVEQVTQGRHDLSAQGQVAVFDLGRDPVQRPQDDGVFLQPFVQAREIEQFHDHLFAPEASFDLPDERRKFLHKLLVRRFGGELDAAAQGLARLPQGGADGVGVQFVGIACSHGMHLELG